MSVLVARDGPVTIVTIDRPAKRNAVDPATNTTQQPMQAFYFNTGITQTDCQSVPADGILIQTPEGVGKVNMQANGVNIQVSSGGRLTDTEMRKVLEGITLGNVKDAGTWTDVTAATP